MKAAVYHGRRDIRIESVPEPPNPGPGEVVLEVTRAAICGTDSSEWAHGPMLTRPPVTLGHEFVGRVVSMGDHVINLSLGDRVVSGAAVSCGDCEWCRAGRTNLCATYLTLGLQLNGGLAELVKTPARICRRVPDDCTDDAAAMAQPLAVALHALRRTNVQPTDACVVIGVGGIGSFILGAAWARGISRLIAVDIDDQRLKTARSIGADIVIDARTQDVEAAVLEATGGDGAHVVIEASGAPGAPETAIKATRRGGRVLIVGLQAAPTEVDLFALTTREVEITTAVAHVCDVDLPESLEIIAKGNLAQTVLDRVIPLDDLVEFGIRPLVEHTARGKIIVDPQAA
jgi:(R,R)-butanediol dehydrogenase / meso-butanediol dehydrogenase / diacetyl reductase